MSSYTSLADALSRIEEQRGNALARGAEQRGQIWGNALGGLGSLIAGIPEQRARLAEAQQRQQLGQLQLTQAQRQMAAEDAYSKAISSPGVIKDDGSIDLEQFRAHVAGTPAAAKFPEMVQHVTAMQEATAKLAKAKQDAAQAEADHVGAIASAADVYDDPQDKAGALLTAISSGVKDGSIPRERGIGIIQGVLGGDGQPDPQRVTSTIAAMKAASKQAAETDEKRAQAASAAAEQRIRAAQLPGAQAESAQKQQVAANMRGGLTADQQADNARAETSVGRSELAQQETARHNLAMEGAAAKRLAAQGAGTPGTAGQLTPEGLELAGTQYRVTGQMPPMGMGRTPERFAVINKAAEQSKILNQTPAATIQKQAAFKADSNALKQMQTLSSGAEASENKAVGQIELIRDLSKKVPRTQVPLLNNAILSGKINLLGDPDAQQLANAIQTFSNEYGKIIEGSTASVAGASDSSRRASAKLVSAAMNPQQLEGVLKLMQREMDLTLAGYDASINHITTKMGGGGAAPAAPANRVYYDANGNPIKGK